MSFRKVAGGTLVLLALGSSFLGVAGIWDFIPGDTATQLFGTAVVLAGGIMATSYVADAFFNEKAKKE